MKILMQVGVLAEASLTRHFDSELTVGVGYNVRIESDRWPKGESHHITPYIPVCCQPLSVGGTVTHFRGNSSSLP